MKIEIQSVVSRGKHTGEMQSPWQNAKTGYFALSAEPIELSEEPHHDAHYIWVPDLQSVANGIRAGLSVRMDSENVAPSLRKPDRILINGKHPSHFDAEKR